ncbi:putative sulfate/molybdate transporter [Salinirubrum litoreum]|uniref:Sulfate/molybdate transporter n=1 Tax=Salinirubrum litoreum TaxID=1126234 RepID=A0ABD5RB87_9EURY
MAFDLARPAETTVAFSRSEAAGAIGDSVTVLPLVVAVGALTELSLAVALGWFGLCQIVWGLYYGVPISVEPMKALTALLLAGTVTTDEFLLAGLVVGLVLLVVGATGTLGRIGDYVGTPVVRGVQFGVALLLLETGLHIGLGDPRLAGLGVVAAGGLAALGRGKLTALAVLVVGGLVAVLSPGGVVPVDLGGLSAPSLDTPGTPALPSFTLPTTGLSVAAAEAVLAQVAMTVGNAALAASILLADYFDREISADDLSISMGQMNLTAVPFGALPMCHGSGGIAGKYAFGARTAGANVLLGLGYLAVAVWAAGLVAAYPVSMLGVVLALVALQLARTSLRETDAVPLVLGVGLLGLLANLGVAFVVGTVVHLAWRTWQARA